MTPELQQLENRLARLIEDIAAGLQAEMSAGVDRIEAATKRNTGMVVSGTLAVSTLKEWAASRDDREKRRDAELRDLRDRVRKLERIVKGRKTA